MKKCSYCAEDIQDEAIICRHCRIDLKTGKPIQSELKEVHARSEVKDGVKIGVGMFIVLPLIIFFIGILFFMFSSSLSKGINKAPISVATQLSSQSIKSTAVINRTFEDLTLGMSEEDFINNVGNHHFGEGKDLYKTYFSHVDSEYMNSLIPKDKLKMQKIDNVHQVMCSFYKGKLFQIEVEYANDYSPAWEIFVDNAKQKYGDGVGFGQNISWSDGKTNLIIKKSLGDQISSYSRKSYGEHFQVTYVDKALFSELQSAEKLLAPKL